MKPGIASKTTEKVQVTIDCTILTELSHSAFFVAFNQPQTKTNTKTRTKKVPPKGRYDIILFEKRL